MLRAVWTKNSGEKLRTCCTKQSVAMTSLLSPHCLLASYPSCYHLLQYNHADILFLISKLSLNQIRLETANSRHTPQHNTLGILSSCPPWISKFKKKNQNEKLLVFLQVHALFSASRCHILASHSLDLTDFKSQRLQQGTWSTFSPGEGRIFEFLWLSTC